MMACPLPREVLADYFACILVQDEADRVETHVFECDRCTRLYDEAGGMAVALRRALAPVIGPERFAALAASGVPLRSILVPPGVPTVVEFTPGIDTLVFRLTGDFTGATRVGLAAYESDGTPITTIEGLPWDAERNELLMTCQRHFMRGSTQATMLVRVFAQVGEDRRGVGEYVIDHRVVADPPR